MQSLSMRLTIFPIPDGSGSRLGEPEALFKDEHRQASAQPHACACHMDEYWVATCVWKSCTSTMPAAVAYSEPDRLGWVITTATMRGGPSMKEKHGATGKLREGHRAGLQESPYQICQKNALWIAHPIEFGRLP